MIEVKIIADSLAPSGFRLTTFVLTYPRFIHSELMTHRAFSRNASSSRAIPVKKQIQMVIDNPAVPLNFLQNQKGMQGGAPILNQEEARRIWLLARDQAVKSADLLADLEVHKQYANRLLEPFAHITVVLSATQFANWFALRYHGKAQPEICQLAKQMWEIYSTNEPDELVEGEWHLPFVSFTESNRMMQFGSPLTGDQKHTNLIKMSVARCARVSYLNHEGKNPTLEEDLQLYDRLLGSTPIHASPAEHQAKAELYDIPSGNFVGWTQYRKMLENENIVKFTGPTEDNL
jgi:thymidylate synthase ThyX